MLEFVEKRDGRTEPRDDRKLNGWGEWGIRNLHGRVDYAKAAGNAVKLLPKVATSQDLMKTLVEQILQEKTWAAYLFAGRLYAVITRKEIFGSETPPTLFAQHGKLQEMGFMASMNYSMSDYSKLEGMIDHRRDFEYPEFSLKFMHEKYAIRNYYTGKVFETPQFIYMRMAMAVCENDPVETRLYNVRRMYNLYSQKMLSNPTPNYLYLGTKHRGFASCCIYIAGDDEESMLAALNITWKMTVNSAGLGSLFSTRTVGDPIGGGRILHSGRYAYLQALAKMTTANKQAGRAGAGTTSTPFFDPEAVDIVQYRNPLMPEAKQLRDLHYNMMGNAFFAQKVADNEEIFTFTEFSHPELYDAFFSPDIERFVELYEAIENNPLITKNYISARKLLLHSFNEAFTTGTAYLSFADEMNRHTPFIIDKDNRINCSNLCVAPETLILTDKGYKRIGGLEGETVNIWNGEEWSEVTIIKTGENQDLMAIDTSAGQSLECTPYHKFYVQDGSSVREVRAQDLVIGDKLIKFDLPLVEGSNILDSAYENGFFSGDGCDTPQGKRVYLYGEKRSLHWRFNVDNWTRQPEHNRIYGNLKNAPAKYWVPLDDYTVNTRLNWLAGYLDADGTITRNQNAQSIQAASTSYVFLQQLQLMLQTLGVHSKIKLMRQGGSQLMPANDGTGELKSYLCNTLWRIVIASSGVGILKNLGLPVKRLVIEDLEPQRDAQHFVTVEFVTDAFRKADTFCFTEPKRHMGVFNGILTGNCTEIMEITKAYYKVMDLHTSEDHGRGEIAMCNLGAINYAEVDYKDDEAMADAAYYSLKAVDYTIMNSDYPFEHLAMTAKARMNAGISVMGLATVLAREGLRWDSFEGKQKIHELYEAHMYHLIYASIRISKERGLAPWIHKTKWPQGWTPMETYNRNVDTIGDFKYRKDWSVVSADIKANGGLAHSTLGTGVPGESSSKALGATNSYFPIPGRTMVKTDGNNITTHWAAQDEDLLKDNYQLAWDIPAKDMIDCYAVMQKWLDQGISADMYRQWARGENTISEEEVVFIYCYMSFMGMKTRYYTRNRRPKQKNMNEVTRLVFADKDGKVSLDPTAVAEEAVAKSNEAQSSAVSTLLTQDATSASMSAVDPLAAIAAAARQQFEEAQAMSIREHKEAVEKQLSNEDATRGDDEYDDGGISETGCSSGNCTL